MSITVSLVTKCFVINEDGKILILRRGQQHFIRPGEWDLPGGRIEANEDPNVSLIREVREEIELKLSGPKVIFISTEIEPAYIFTFFYKADYDNTPITLSSEHTEYDWVSRSDFMKLELPEKFGLAARWL